MEVKDSAAHLIVHGVLARIVDHHASIRRTLSASAIFTLAARASSGPQFIGGGKFMASAGVPSSGQTATDTKVLEAANSHCALQGKEAMEKSNKPANARLCGEAEVVCRWVDLGRAGIESSFG